MTETKAPKQDEVERIILRRLWENRIDGYTIDMAREIALLFATPLNKEEGAET